MKPNPFKCCMGCTDRYPGCHGHCDRYQEAKLINEKRKHDEYLKNQASMYLYKHVGNVLDDQAKRRKGCAGYQRFSKGSG